MHRMFLHEKNILKLVDSALLLKKPSKKNPRPMTEAYLLFPFYAGTLFDVVSRAAAMHVCLHMYLSTSRYHGVA